MASRAQAALERPARARLRDRRMRERALIAAAGKLFASQGYEATKTREIAAAAGCAEGLIHRYFGNKEGLLRALIEDHSRKALANGLHDLRMERTLEKELVSLLNCEIERTYAQREFLNVILPRAILDPGFRAGTRRILSAERTRALAARLARFQRLTPVQLSGAAEFIGINAFVLGYVWPVILKIGRKECRSAAAAQAALFIRGLERG
jgi:AcrR family transcriptional regulator